MMEGPGDDSEEKREPASDIDTAVVKSLKELDLDGRLKMQTSSGRRNLQSRHIRYQHKIISAAWSSVQSLWTLEVEQADGRHTQLCCPFIFSCAGYYNHHKGYLPEWPGYRDYKGTLVHPQFWPEDLDYTGQRIVIVGSGATAVTLAPALAEKAAEVIQ